MNKVASNDKQVTTVSRSTREVVDKVKQKATGEKVRVKTNVLIKYISLVKEIVEYAEDNKVDMIVIGSRGMTL